MSDEIEDPLKDLSEVYKPDVRQANLVGDLSDNHAVLSQMVLHGEVPLNVRQLFETAKNASLYSWFVYRFHQVAELVAFSALELALRERAGDTEFAPPTGAWIPGLKELLIKAKEGQWIRTEDFPSLRDMAAERAKHLQFERFLQNQGMAPEEIVPVLDPTEEEIAAAMCEIDVPQILIDATPQLRNSLAHGSSRLSPTSLWTLRLTSEAINQMFGSRETPPQSVPK
jgi:hypothetical protein